FAIARTWARGRPGAAAVRYAVKTFTGSVSAMGTPAFSNGTRSFAGSKLDVAPEAQAFTAATWADSSDVWWATSASRAASAGGSRGQHAGSPLPSLRASRTW